VGAINMPANSVVLLRKAKRKEWLVYTKKSFAGSKRVLEYLGRYAHRVAIANHRIEDISNGKVTFAYKDCQNRNSTKKMTLTATDKYSTESSHPINQR